MVNQVFLQEIEEEEFRQQIHKKITKTMEVFCKDWEEILQKILEIIHWMQENLDKKIKVVILDSQEIGLLEGIGKEKMIQ